MDVDAPKGEYDTDENYAVDYSNLKPELRLASDQAQRDRLDAEMRDECNERAATLEKLEPNMKALEQYDQILEKEKRQATEIENAREKLNACQISFQRLGKREVLDLEAHLSMSKRISEACQELTKGTWQHPTGGQAFLTLENSDEPFLGGVNFTAMPPSKRYREMEMLSERRKPSLLWHCSSRFTPIARRRFTSWTKSTQPWISRTSRKWPDLSVEIVRQGWDAIDRHFAQGQLLRQGGIVSRRLEKPTQACSKEC